MTRRLSDKEGQDSSDKNTKNGNKANGVVYTPQEVIDFMVAETSRLLKENFGEDSLGTGGFLKPYSDLRLKTAKTGAWRRVTRTCGRTN